MSSRRFFFFLALAFLSLVFGPIGCGGGGASGTTSGGNGGGNGGGQGMISQIFGGVAVSNVQAVNNLGGIVANRSLNEAAYQSPTGTITYLPCPAGSTQNIAYSLNGGGTIAGTCVILNENESVPAVWNNSTLSVLQSPAFTQFPLSSAYSVNDSSQIVGAATSSTATEGLYWSSATSAPVVIGPSGFIPYGINAGGEIVGYVPSGATWTYYLLTSTNATPKAVGALSVATGTTVSASPPIYINTEGQITYNGGSATAPEVYLVSAAGQSKAIGAGKVFSINTAGDVAGALVDAQNPSEQTGAFVYTAQSGMENLQSYLPSGSGWSLISAHSINDSGMVVGEGNLNGVSLWYKLQLPKGAY